MNLLNLRNERIFLTIDEISFTWFFMTGMTTKQIAAWMGLPESKIYWLRKKVMIKAVAKNKNDLIGWFLNIRSLMGEEKIETYTLKKRDSHYKR